VKLSAKIFSTFLILVLVATGLFFSSVKAIKFFSEKESSSLKKKISSKPRDMKDKQALVKLGASPQDDFTFFDVLDDPEMKKYIGLNGSVVATKEEDYYKSNDLTPEVDVVSLVKLFNPSLRMYSLLAQKTLEVKSKLRHQRQDLSFKWGLFRRFKRLMLLKIN